LEWGNDWIKRHSAACVAAKKPCLFEEYGVMAEEKCSQETGWQKVSLETKGNAGDMYWQYGDKISTGQTADDQFTVFRNTENWNCMVNVHGQNVKKLPAGNGL
jgi:mannan endo-1,4-beta-mannosidase